MFTVMLSSLIDNAMLLLSWLMLPCLPSIALSAVVIVEKYRSREPVSLLHCLFFEGAWQVLREDQNGW